MTLRKTLALVLCLLCLTGCGRKEAPTPPAPAPSSSVVRYRTLEQALAECTDLLRGQFVARHDRGSWQEWEFRVVQRLKGATRADTVFVEGAVVQAYVPGQEYLLVLERQVSVYQQHDRYAVLCDLYLPLADPKASKLGGQPLNEHMEQPQKLASADGFTEYARQLALAGNRETFTGTDYCRSEDMDAVAAASPFILQIRVEELLVAGRRQDRETYWCTVEKALRGQPQAGIWVVFPYGMASPGGQYLALLDRSSEDSLIYTMTSRVSILPLEDRARVDAVLQYLE